MAEQVDKPVETNEESSLGYIDEIQDHVLGIIISMMSNYRLTPDHVKVRYDYLVELYKNYSADAATQAPAEETEAEESSESSESDNESNESTSGPLFVSTRREFCHAMSSGVKICPKYSTCVESSCKNFHIEPQYLCPHMTRGSYCEHTDCELIVIRPCRKGKRCNDNDCSFRHNF